MRWLVLIASAVLLFFAQAEGGSVAGRLNTSSVDLETALTTAIQPLLQNLSSRYNSSAWGFAYRDADINVAFCAGYSNIPKKIPCKADDVYAWGSTTKSQTSVMILKLQEQGKLKLDDQAYVHANAFFKHISGNKLDLLSLYGPEFKKVTIRNLLQHTSGLSEYDDPFVRTFQNTHRLADLSPPWIVNTTNRSFLFPPGSAGEYSSTNFVLLGLVLAAHAGVESWDKLDQTAWKPAEATRKRLFATMQYGVHGPCGNFKTATGGKGGTISGYQPICKPPSPPSPHPHPHPSHHHACVNASETDVVDMSSTQGWTCGNLLSSPADVADYFWWLLGPPSESNATALLTPESMKELLTFKTENYFGRNKTCPNYSCFGYGLGMMNFTSMDWGFANHGEYYGHNGLTYGFGSQSGYNYPLKFAATWVNNFEHWIGPDSFHGSPNGVYEAMVQVVKQYR